MVRPPRRPIAPTIPSRPRIQPSLVQKIRVAPHVPLRITVRFDAKSFGPAEAAEELKRRGIGVRYIQAPANLIAAEARGEKILLLAAESWIISVVEDPGPAAASKPSAPGAK